MLRSYMTCTSFGHLTSYMIVYGYLHHLLSSTCNFKWHTFESSIQSDVLNQIYAQMLRPPHPDNLLVSFIWLHGYRVWHKHVCDHGIYWYKIAMLVCMCIELRLAFNGTKPENNTSNNPSTHDTHISTAPFIHTRKATLRLIVYQMCFNKKSETT